MIPGNEVFRLTHLGPRDIAQALANSGYSGISYERVRFREVDDSSDLVYEVWPFDDSGTANVESYRVILTYNPTTNTLSARIGGPWE